MATDQTERREKIIRAMSKALHARATIGQIKTILPVPAIQRQADLVLASLKDLDELIEREGGHPDGK